MTADSPLKVSAFLRAARRAHRKAMWTTRDILKPTRRQLRLRAAIATLVGEEPSIIRMGRWLERHRGITVRDLTLVGIYQKSRKRWRYKVAHRRDPKQPEPAPAPVIVQTVLAPTAVVHTPPERLVLRPDWDKERWLEERSQQPIPEAALVEAPAADEELVQHAGETYEAWKARTYWQRRGLKKPVRKPPEARDMTAFTKAEAAFAQMDMPTSKRGRDWDPFQV